MLNVFATVCMEPNSIPSAAFKASFITLIFTTFDGDFRFLIDVRSCKATPTLTHLHTGTRQSVIEIPHVSFNSFCSDAQLNVMD